MKKETAQKAAKWWGAQLRKGMPDIESKINEPSLDPVMLGLALAYQNMESKKLNITPELIDRFELALTAVLMKQTEDMFRISVDYWPDHILLEAAARAGLELGQTTLPWKTITWIQGDRFFLVTEDKKEVDL